MNTLEGIIEDVEKSELVSDKVIKKVRELIGQEKWQELHDEESDIITTAGELLITLKGIPDLEEQIEKMSEYINFINKLDFDGFVERFYEVCKFIAVLCGTATLVVFTVCGFLLLLK